MTLNRTLLDRSHYADEQQSKLAGGLRQRDNPPDVLLIRNPAAPHWPILTRKLQRLVSRRSIRAALKTIPKTA